MSRTVVVVLLAAAIILGRNHALFDAADALNHSILICVNLPQVDVHVLPNLGELVSNAGTDVSDAKEGREGGKDDDGDGVDVDVHVCSVPYVWGEVKQSDGKNGKKFVSSYDM